MPAAVPPGDGALVAPGEALGESLEGAGLGAAVLGTTEPFACGATGVVAAGAPPVVDVGGWAGVAPGPSVAPDVGAAVRAGVGAAVLAGLGAGVPAGGLPAAEKSSVTVRTFVEVSRTCQVRRCAPAVSSGAVTVSEADPPAWSYAQSRITVPSSSAVPSASSEPASLAVAVKLGDEPVT